jgi:thiosulfate/3-mercaptopyruvate sulfurtransferase
MNNILPIIQAAELKTIYHRDNLVIVDASNGKDALLKYEESHLDGALFVDMNTQLADIKKDLSDGGRHPLPKIEDFAEVLTSLGISTTSHIVIYDDKNCSNAAARFWWMLQSVGHKKVQVLDGGFQAAQKKG